MFEFLRNITTNPFSAFLGVIVTWIILRVLLINVLKISTLAWTRLEYVWIGIGILGVLTVVDENRKQFQLNELENVENWIENDSESLLRFTNNQMHCFQYNNTGIFTQQEFDKRQSHSDSICSWMKEVGIVVSNSIKNGHSKIDTIPELLVSKKEEEFAFEQTQKDILKINEYIIRRDKLIISTSDNFWKGFKYSFGILLLIVAFGIRLTIISNKVNKEKNKA
jgi:hypothetical protein